MPSSQTLEESKALRDWSVEHRRNLHRKPELSLKEESTAGYCRDLLAGLGYEVRDSWGYGFTADLNIPGAERRIAWRADMDALPIQELNDHEFVSTNPGVAHMCGHDTHMTVALTAARMLAERREQLSVNVRLLFQPSEELPPGGALGMIEAGCLDGVDEVYGLHNDPGTPVGTVRTRVGPITAAADRFRLKVVGRGCHAARPQDGLDPLAAAAGLVGEWQTIISRRINPVRAAVLSVTRFHAGTTFNIIPGEAELEGTVRTFDGADRDLIEAQMQASLAGLQARGYQCEWWYERGYDSIVNHEAGVARIAQASCDVLGDDAVSTDTDPAAWGEDFAYYLQQRPGCFLFLGSGNAEKGIVEPLHSARFRVDEDCLPIGAAIVTQMMLNA